MENNIENLILESKKRLSMTCVVSVDAFSEQQLKITVSGKNVIINGKNIKIISFNQATGNLTADGDFLQIKYDGEKIPIKKRIFK